MDKRAIFLIVINIVISIALGISAYFTYGFRFVDGVKVDASSNMNKEDILINGEPLQNFDILPNDENLTITFNVDVRFRIIMNPKAHVSYRKNGMIMDLSDEDYSLLLNYRLNGQTITIDTQKRTLEESLQNLYVNDEISEVSETSELWLFAIEIIANKKIVLQLNDVCVDLGPEKIELDRNKVIL